MRDFEDLIAWQKARVLSQDIHRIALTGAFRKHHVLRDQICRAAISVMSNIAEGFGRFGPADFRRYVVIARGSNAEVRSQLYVAADLGFIDRDTQQRLTAQCREIDRILAGLWTSLGRTLHSGP